MLGDACYWLVYMIIGKQWIPVKVLLYNDVSGCNRNLLDCSNVKQIYDELEVIK